MNANEYINGMADLKALRASGEIKSATNCWAPTLLEGGIELRMDFGF